MRGGKVPQVFRRYLAVGKIKLAQGTLHPDIHRKRPVKTTGKQQCTIGYFIAHAPQLHQFRSRFGQRQMTKPVQIKFAGGDLPGGGEQMRRAKTHLARAQGGFGGSRDSLRRWK